MDGTLAENIKRAYPNGLIYGLDKARHASNERDERLKNMISAVSKKCLLNVTLGPFDKPAYNFAFTQKENPFFDEWIWVMRNPQKIKWIASNNGEPYVAYWLTISRVADYYDCFYNHWVPRGNTGS